MKINKTLIILSLLLIFCISLSAVSATDNININDTDQEDVINIDGYDGYDYDEDFREYGSYTELDEIINPFDYYSSEVTLNQDYAYYRELDRFDRVSINDRGYVIDGNGHTINGGGVASVFCVQANDVIIKNINFINTCSDQGGAITLWGNNVSLINCTFTNCYDVEYGGAIFCFKGSDCNLVNCTFTYCHGGLQGGAIFYYDMSYNEVNINNCRFIDCSASGQGGAIYCNSSDYFNLNNCYFEKCSSSEGGAIFCVGDNNLLVNCKFNNCSAWIGGAIYWAGDNNSVSDCSFTDCSADLGKNIYIKISKSTVTITPTILSTTYDSGKYFQVKVLDANNKAVSGLKLTFKVYTGSSYKTVTVTTDANGIAKYSASTLSIGTHKVIVSLSNDNYVASSKTSSIKVSKAPTTVTAKKVTYKKGAKKYFKVTVKNKTTGKVVKSLAIKIKVYTGKKYKTYTVKTNSKGIAQLSTKALKKGTHKVVISSGNSKYTVSKSGKLIVIK